MTTALVDNHRHISYDSIGQVDGSLLAAPPASGEQATVGEGHTAGEHNAHGGSQNGVIAEAALANTDSPTEGPLADRLEGQAETGDDEIVGRFGGEEAQAHRIASIPSTYVPQETETPSREDGFDDQANPDVATESNRDGAAASTHATQFTDSEASMEPFNTQELALSETLLRPQTPASRTSTPPLIAPAKKSSSVKFSSINVTKEFLRKQAIPPPATSTSKSGSLNGEAVVDCSHRLTHTCRHPAASPVPIPSASSRLLSAKLITVPISKSSTSPHPPSSASAQGSVASSPWAKPSIPLTSEVSKDPQILHQPAPKHGRTLISTVSTVMGSGQGIGASAPKPAWRQVQSEGKRAALGISREFPTTNEIAEGKRNAITLNILRRTNRHFQAKKWQSRRLKLMQPTIRRSCRV